MLSKFFCAFSLVSPGLRTPLLWTTHETNHQNSYEKRKKGRKICLEIRKKMIKYMGLELGEKTLGVEYESGNSNNKNHSQNKFLKKEREAGKRDTPEITNINIELQIKYITIKMTKKKKKRSIL
ncbi:MAG: hypothetical protein Q8875_02600 [Pigeon pea little leaf phytoplasma]|nr:hypothetical protein [Pigeon pea little leaf phytoplasma]